MTAALKNNGGSGRSSSLIEYGWIWQELQPWRIRVDLAEVTILRNKVDWKEKQPWIKRVDLAVAAALKDSGGSGKGSSLMEWGWIWQWQQPYGIWVDVAGAAALRNKSGSGRCNILEEWEWICQWQSPFGWILQGHHPYQNRCLRFLVLLSPA